MKRLRRGKLVPTFIVLLILALSAVLWVLYDPFWLVERGTDVYLWQNGVQQHDITVHAHRIHYLEALPPKGSPEKPIVLIHGLGARASDWAVLTPTLAKHGYHVYALDLLGYGRSDKPLSSDYSLSAEERIVAGFIDALHLSRPDVGGWSMGGWLAMKYALDQPTRVRRLLLFDSAGLYMPVDFSLSLFTPVDRAGLDALTYRIEPDHQLLHLPDFAVPGLLRRMHRSARIVNSSLASMLDGREILDFRAHHLKMPVLLIWGSEDKLTPIAYGRRLHDLIPHSTLVELNGCGHLAIAECAAQAVPAAIDFLDADPPPPPSVKVLPAREAQFPVSALH